MSVELEVVDGRGARLLVVARCEVWRGHTGAIVASWDPVRGQVEVVLDAWESLPLESYTCTWQPLGSAPPSDTPPAARWEIEGLLCEAWPLSPR